MEEKIRFDPDLEILSISNFLRSNLESSRAKGYVLGVSGGIDSAVVASLCQRSVGSEHVLGLLLFEDYHKNSNDYIDAMAIVEQLKIKSIDLSITPLITAFEQTLHSREIKASRMTLANMKARIRMTLLYALANQENYLVAGTGDKSEDLIGYFCYDEKTSVVTSEGPKGWDALKRGDIVYSYDLGSDEVVESKVDGVYVFDYEGDMINFKSKNADLMVTPNHRMLVRTSCGDLGHNKIRVRTAEECFPMKYTVIPVPKGWSGKSNLPTSLELTFRQNHIERTISLSIEDAFYLIGLFVGDGSVFKVKSRYPQSQTFPAKNMRWYHAIHRDGLPLLPQFLRVQS